MFPPGTWVALALIKDITNKNVDNIYFKNFIKT